MLAATDSGISAIVVVGVVLGALLFLWHFLSWPRRRPPTGLGAGYEQLVQSQSGRVIVPQTRRVRPDPAASQADAASRGARMLRRLWWPTLVPAWVSIPLIFLGFLFVFFMPFVGWDWFAYGSAVAIAVVLGIWTARRYRVTVLERTEDGIVVWIRWTQKSAEPEPRPVAAPPANP